MLAHSRSASPSGRPVAALGNGRARGRFASRAARRLGWRFCENNEVAERRMRPTRAGLLRISVAVVSALLWSGIAGAQESDLVRAETLSRQVIDLHRGGRYGEAIPFAKE